MSKPKPSKKRVIVTKRTASSGSKKTFGSREQQEKSGDPDAIIFHKSNYLWMIGGIVLIALGLLLMSGGQMPDPEVWDEGIIYSFRRITLAPIVIIAGLIMEIYAIFKK